MESRLLLLLLAPVGIVVALPAITDLLMWLRGLTRSSALPAGRPRDVPLIILVPAHNEELLIERTVRSLRGQSYPAGLLEVVVVADNCTDGTVALARANGATVLERHDTERPGKHQAIGWALERLEWRRCEAVVIVDADTIVDADYASQLSRWPDLSSRAMQTYDHLSNERENSLTRLAGLLTRTRYDIALPLKAGAGFSVPMTGDGIVLGREILERHPWNIQTITEGWELYTLFTLEGQIVSYEPRARLYAQETRSLEQSRTQRERWTAGRLEVLRLNWRRIVGGPGVPFVQRLDLLAELMSVGPVIRATVGVAGAAVCLALGSTSGGILAGLFLTGLAQPALYSILVLFRHPEPWPTVRALAYLAPYSAWRTMLALRTLFNRQAGGRWTRTHRREEGGPSHLPPS